VDVVGDARFVEMSTEADMVDADPLDQIITRP
jgi:hypothetical protein